jgi:hypothetical protein
LAAAKTVVAEITRQVKAGREMASNPMLSSSKRESVLNDCNELEKFIPLVISTTKDAFARPHAQERLRFDVVLLKVFHNFVYNRDIIAKIGEYNERIEATLKPDSEKPGLSLPISNYNPDNEVCLILMLVVSQYNLRSLYWMIKLKL